MKTEILHSRTVLRGQGNNLFLTILFMYITYEQEHYVYFKNTYISKWMYRSEVNGHILNTLEWVPMVKRKIGIFIEEKRME